VGRQWDSNDIKYVLSVFEFEVRTLICRPTGYELTLRPVFLTIIILHVDLTIAHLSELTRYPAIYRHQKIYNKRRHTIYSIGIPVQTYIDPEGSGSFRLPGFSMCTSNWRGTQWRSRLRHCATNRKFAGSIPNGIIGIFQWLNPSRRIVALGSTQPLTEMSTRNLSWG
jgi:hypothetical protein